MWDGEKAAASHRIAYELFNGPIPDGMYVCHSCDNPPCTNPRHLWLGTAKDNTHDAVSKGRMKTPPRKPTDFYYPAEVVAEMRARYAAGETTGQLEAATGISRRSIRLWVTGQRRAEVGNYPLDVGTATAVDCVLPVGGSPDPP